MLIKGIRLIDTTPTTPSAIAHPIFIDEFNGPFTSWATVSTTANGIVDNTSAIQAAINSVGNESSTKAIVFLPAGSYKITGTLNFLGKQNVSFIGAHPSTTTITWAGASNTDMVSI